MIGSIFGEYAPTLFGFTNLGLAFLLVFAWVLPLLALCLLLLENILLLRKVNLGDEF